MSNPSLTKSRSTLLILYAIEGPTSWISLKPALTNDNASFRSIFARSITNSSLVLCLELRCLSANV